MGFSWKRGLVKLNWRERRQFVSAHIYLNTGGDVFGQPNDMINHLLIMRLYFLLILPLCDDTVFALMFICVEICEVPCPAIHICSIFDSVLLSDNVGKVNCPTLVFCI